MRVTDSSTNLTPFFSSAVGVTMLRPRPGTTSARGFTGSWAQWLSRMVNEMMPAPTPQIVCFPEVVISFGVESPLNSRILSFSPGISSSSRNDSDAPLSTSSVAPLVLGVNSLVASAVEMKPPSKSLLLPAKLMTGFSLSGDSLCLGGGCRVGGGLNVSRRAVRTARVHMRYARLLVRPCCPLAVALFVAVRGSPVDRASLPCSVWLGPGLKFGAVPLGVPALLALEAVDVVIRRCLGCHGDATPGYASLRPVPRLLIEKHVSHGGLHLVDVEGRVAVHRHLHILVLIGEVRDADVLELPVGYLLSHLLDPDAEKTLLVEVVVWVLSRLHRRVHELVHGCADDLIGDLVVVPQSSLKDACPSPLTSLLSSYFWTQGLQVARQKGTAWRRDLHWPCCTPQFWQYRSVSFLPSAKVRCPCA